MNSWEELGEYLFCRKVGEGRYHFIQVDELESDGDGEAVMVSLSEVDVMASGPKMLEEAMSCVDLDEAPEDEKSQACLLHDYGFRAPMGSWTGESFDNYELLLAKAKKESNKLRNHEYHEQQMTRTVNRIGSTAREFMFGNLNRALTNTMASGTTEGVILSKIHGLTEEQRQSLPSMEATQGVALTVDPGFIKRHGISDDPLALCMGFMHALSGQGLDRDRKPLAAAYIQGFKEGVDVFAGRSPKPDWVK